ncbi:hypothetical protein RDI58_024403 [Solanum bulbocastanum]|uniref:Uncharacterized protein n=1 Tax=Solanum bulbocastanum TaxID=147425 RepID=A0AAN8Y2X9_SOLBU
MKVYIASFSIGMGAGPWLIMSEEHFSYMHLFAYLLSSSSTKSSQKQKEEASRKFMLYSIMSHEPRKNKMKIL